MSLFFLRKGFTVIATPTGGQVVHARTGDVLSNLSLEDIPVLARAAAEGIDEGDSTNSPLVKKLASLGVLVASSAPPAQAASAPASTHASAPSDESTVPLMRGDLAIVRKEGSSLFEVTHPQTKLTFPLYDFEVSLARMLDGQRTYAEVVSAGQKIGIPLSTKSLAQFIRQLEKYGFLAAAGSTAQGTGRGSLWQPRDKWDESLRTLFQSGLRMHRAGKYAEATGYFEAVLQQDPSNAEAREMLAQVQASEEATEAAELLPPVPAPKVSGERVEFVESIAPPQTTLAQAPEPTDAVPNDTDFRTAFPKAKGRKWVLVVVAAAVLGAGVFAWVNFSQPADEPTPVATVVPAPTPAPVEALPPVVEEVIDAGAPQPVEVVAAPPEPAAFEPATVDEPKVEAPKVEAPQVEAPKADEPQRVERPGLVATVSRRGRVKMGEVTAPGEGTVTWTAAQNDRLSRNQAVGSLEVDGKRKALKAPKPGLFVPKVESGAEVKAGQVLAVILYHEAFLQTQVLGEKPGPEWACEVVHDATRQTAPCHVVSATPRGKGSFVTATTEPRWVDEVPDPVVLKLSAPP